MPRGFSWVPKSMVISWAPWGQRFLRYSLGHFWGRVTQLGQAVNPKRFIKTSRMSLTNMMLMLSTREVEKSWYLRKFDLWPAITESNIDLGPIIIPPIARLVYSARAICWFFFREALRRFVWKRQGGSHPPPYTGEGGKTRFTGEG